MKERDVVATFYHDNVSKDGKVCYGTAMANMNGLTAEEKKMGSGQNLYLSSTTKPVDGEKKPSHKDVFSVGQRDAIIAAAGDKIQPLVKDGKEIGVVASINCDLVKRKSGPGLTIDTSKPMKAGPDIGENVLREHGSYMKRVSAAIDTKKDKGRALPSVAAEAEAPQAEAEVG